MAAPHDNDLVALIKCWMPTPFLHALARHFGLVQRQRDIDPALLVWTLVFGWTAGHTHSLRALHRAYQRHALRPIAVSSFYEKLRHPGLLELMRHLLQHHMNAQTQGSLGPFRDLLALDATTLRLFDGLAAQYPSTNAGQAGAKLQVVYSIAKQSPTQVLIHPAKTHEQRVWKGMGDWVAGRLLLMDLGYLNYWLFHRVHAHRGFFLTRLKSNCALRICENHSPGPGRKGLVGKTVREALEGTTRDELELVVEVPVELRSGALKTYRWRVFARRTREGVMRAWMSNAPASLMTLDDVPQLYALRWQVELLFKGLKSMGRLHRMPTRNEVVMLILLHAALLFILLSGWLSEAMHGVEKIWKTSVLQGVTVLREHGEVVLHELFCEERARSPFSPLDIFRIQRARPSPHRPHALSIPLIADFTILS